MNIMDNAIDMAMDSHNRFESKTFINRQIACESVPFRATMLSLVCISARRSIKWSISNLLCILFSYKSGRYFFRLNFLSFTLLSCSQGWVKMCPHMCDQYMPTYVVTDVRGYLCGAKITGISANRRISKISGAKNAARHKEFVNNRRFDSFDTRWSIDGVERHDSHNHVQ